MSTAIGAAVRTGARYGYACDEPILLQDTNNSVVWLKPHAVIAKVGTRPGSAELLRREHDVAMALARVSAPIASPTADALPIRDAATGFAVTLWERLARSAAAPSERDLATSLARLHEVLAAHEDTVPTFRAALDRSRVVLDDDASMQELDPACRVELRRAFDELRALVDARTWVDRVLHGEPHDGNWICTPHGIRWIDLETVCRGPLEWDLAFLDEETATLFDGVDPELLGLLRILNSARVATWCWARANHPAMRPHAEHHLAVVQRWAAASP